MARKTISRNIVADSAICHGKPTFVGTRIMVAQVLRQLAKGLDVEQIRAEWRGRISAEAIGEAVELAVRALDEHGAEYALEPAGR